MDSPGQLLPSTIVDPPLACTVGLRPVDRFLGHCSGGQGTVDWLDSPGQLLPSNIADPAKACSVGFKQKQKPGLYFLLTE